MTSELQHINKKNFYNITHSVDSSSKIFQSDELRQPALDLPVDRNLTPRVLEECPELLQTIQVTCRHYTQQSKTYKKAFDMYPGGLKQIS